MSELAPEITFDTTSSVRSAVSAMPRGDEVSAEPQRLSAAALALAEIPVKTAYSPIVLAGFVRMIEAALIVAIGLAVYIYYVAPVRGFGWHYPAAILGITLFVVLAFQAADIYQVQAFRGREKQYMRLASAWSLVFVIVIGVSFFAKAGDQFSYMWLGSYYIFGLLTLVASRRILFLLVRAWTREGRLKRRTVIVGGGERGLAVVAALQTQKDSDIEMIGVFDDRGNERSREDCGGLPKLGTVDDLIEFRRRTRVDLIILSLPVSAERRILQMLKKLWALPLDIQLAAHTNDWQFRPRSQSFLGDVAVIHLLDRPLADWDAVMKWLFDKIVGSLILVAALPLMGLIALIIKLESRGPVIFRQKRYGFNNEAIEVYKFRSMYIDQCDATGAKVVTRDDQRVTRVGRIIRKTSVDELPQLFNVVFNGNLSLVGPRPHPINVKVEAQLWDQAVDGYFARHRVKPGITGWAQINGWRGEIDTQEKIKCRVEHDLYYIENWSLLFDLYILANTPFALMNTESAY